MTQIEREELVERYLAGEMSQIEESDFFLHVAVDNELQRTLRAFRIMDNAIRNDREVVVAERSRYRENIMALLAATPIAGGAVGAGMAAGSSSAGSTAGAAAGGGSSIGASSAGASSVTGTASTAVSSSAGVAASTGVAATTVGATTVGATTVGASAGILGSLGLGVWKVVMMVIVGGMLAAGTAAIFSSGSSDREEGAIPDATAPAAIQDGPVTGVPPIDSLAVDEVAGAALDSTPAAPKVNDAADARELRAPAASGRTSKATALRSRENGRSQPSGEADGPYPRKKNPVINLGTQSNNPSVSVEVDRPKQNK